MNLTLILYSLFYTGLFIVACMVVSTCIMRIIQMLYASRATMLHLLDDEEEREAIHKHIDERVMGTLERKK